MGMGNDNGKLLQMAGVDGGTQSISVKCAPGTQKISIDMDVPSLDVALSLLERAHREIESRFRFMRAQELALEAQQNARMAQIAGDVMASKARGV